MNIRDDAFDSQGSLDEIAQLRQELVALKQQLFERDSTIERINEQLKIFMEYTPISLAMFDCEMRYILVSRYWRTEYQMSDEEQIIGRSHYEIFPNMPEYWRSIHQRCLMGAVEEHEEDPYLGADGSQEWLAWKVYPWYTQANQVGGLIIFSQKVTQRKRAELALAQSEVRLQQIVTQQQALIETVNQLSTPVIPVAEGILVLPMIGIVDSRRAQLALEALMSSVTTTQAHVIILDITGVPIVDTEVANVLIHAAQAVKLLGGKIILTGIRPEVAQTLVNLGIDLRGLVTCSTLQRGISLAAAYH